MGLDSLLGNYDSDDEGEGEKFLKAAALQEANAKTVPSLAAAVESAPGPSAAKQSSTTSGKAELRGPHGPACDCEGCEALLARFVAKSLQTKGIRFKCRLCDVTMATKASAGDHFVTSHAAPLQDFKRQKDPALFKTSDLEKVLKGRGVPQKQFSFARDAVLKKRPIDADSSFGGWAKKEKPEPPPCEQPGYQEEIDEPVFTAPPWLNKPTACSSEEVSAVDKEFDDQIRQAQGRRFAKRNILEVNALQVRCKLCYPTTLGSVAEAEKHVIEKHGADFQKEMEIWNRFLHTSCKRQPPFGWVCKICQIIFPTDGSVWRHLGKEVFIRREDRHLDNWTQKEDRWGHEEDAECCGDGLNVARGLSYDSVKMFQDQFAQENMQKDVGGVAEAEGEASSEEEALPDKPGEVKFIQEF